MVGPWPTDPQAAKEGARSVVPPSPRSPRRTFARPHSVVGIRVSTPRNPAKETGGDVDCPSSGGLYMRESHGLGCSIGKPAAFPWDALDRVEIERLRHSVRVAETPAWRVQQGQAQHAFGTRRLPLDFADLLAGHRTCELGDTDQPVSASGASIAVVA